MSINFSRRTTLLSGLAASTSIAMPRLFAADVTLAINAVTFRPEIEPLVRLLEETSREAIFEAVAEEIRAGRSYRELLAALFLAAIRNVQPRPSVGFKFHSVLVVNSAHLASLAAHDNDRWLPIFWAIDYFKRAQQQDISEGDWTMAAVNEERLPSANDSLDELRRAMTNWDVEAADAAAAVAARVLPAHVLFDLFSHFGARDFRSIGHKAIYVASAFRVLNVIGWQHAEPVMRGLAYALLNHTGDPNPAQADLAVDRAGRENEGRAHAFRRDWLTGRSDSSATDSFVVSARTSSPTELSEATSQWISSGVGVASIYDGMFATAAELVMRQPQIVPLHAMTTTNAIHYLYQHTHNEATRRWLLLQNAAFLSHFREAAEGRGKLGPQRINDLEPDESVSDLDAVFAVVGSDSDKQAAAVLGFLSEGGTALDFVRHARQLIFRKGNDSHDYKYSSALLEDYYSRSPEWRDKILAAGSYLLAGSKSRDTDLPERVKAAFE